MERFHSENYDTTDDDKREGDSNDETDEDCQQKKEEDVEEEEVFDEDEEVEEEEEEEDDDDDGSEFEEVSGETGNQRRTIKLQSPPTALRISYDALNAYAKIHSSVDDCYINSKKIRGGLIRMNVDEFLLDTSKKIKSCEPLQESDFLKVYDDSSKKKPSQRTQILRNLLDESAYCQEIRTDDPSYLEAKGLVSEAGPLSKDTILRHVIILRKQTKSGGDNGILFCIFNNDSPPSEYKGKVDDSRKKTFISMYTEAHLLASSTTKHYHFHDFFKNLLRLQVYLIYIFSCFLHIFFLIIIIFFIIF